MAKEERNLVDALAREERPTGHGVTEAMHRGQCAVRHLDRLAKLAALVQDWESRASVKVNRVLLGLPERPSDIALPEGPTRARGEDELVRSGELRALLVSAENRCELMWDRHGSHGAVRLCGLDVAMAVHLRRKLHLGVLQV